MVRPHIICMEKPMTPTPSPKGRGTGLNPVNRFELIFTERTEWYETGTERFETVPYKTEIYRDATKTIINYNDSPDVGFNASINPYRGCEHGCIYCYARPGHEYLGLSSGIDFESKIFAKVDGPVLLEKELSKKSWKPQVIVMSGVTDPYQPVERRLGITRQCLQVLNQFKNPVAIITKSALIKRDIDILEEMNSWHGVSVNISVTSLDKKLARVMEPRASQPQDRMDTIAELRKHNIPVNVMVAPVIPAVNDFEIPSILKAVAGIGALSAAYVVVRLPYANKELFENWLERHFPERKSKVLNRLRQMRQGKLYHAEFGTRMSAEGPHAEQIRQLFDINCRKFGLNRQRIGLSTQMFRNPKEEIQYKLF